MAAESETLPPGPDGYPLVGNTPQLMRDPFAFYETLESYGDVVRFETTGWTFTALLHPDHVERVLVEEPARFERWDFADVGLDFAPEGLLLTDGEQWHRQRQIMQPAFTVDRIRSYADTMVAYANRVASEWTDGEEVALNRTFSKLTLRILGRRFSTWRSIPATTTSRSSARPER